MTFISAAEAAKLAQSTQLYSSNDLLDEINNFIKTLAVDGKRNLYFPILKSRASLETIQSVEKELVKHGFNINLDARDKEKYVLQIIY